MRNEQLLMLAEDGIIVPEYAEFLKDGWRENPALAMDAQPTLTTAASIGIPNYLANLLDPKSVRVLFSPMKAVEIFGETKKGNWTTLTTQFPLVESTGTTSSYGDYNNNGIAGSNYNWVPRQSYHFQTNVQYGERETEMFGLAQINYVADKNFSANLVLSKFQNKSYFLGIFGLQNYGALNDPGLLASIAPVAKVGGGTSWGVAYAYEVFNDVLALYTQLQTQMLGLIERDTPMTLGISPTSEPKMGKVTKYTLATVREAILKEFKNLRIVTAPEYSTDAGELMQLVVDEVDGDKTAYCAFTEKMRAHRLVLDSSFARQKRSGGTWGTIIRRPVAVASMLGI